MNKFWRFFPLILIIILFSIAHKYKISDYLTYATLKQYHIQLANWVNSHFILAIIIFSLCYILIVAASIPGATIGTLIGGFLFGSILGTFIIVVSATIGATCLFLAVKLALGEYITKKIGSKVKFMERHFHKHSFYYLLSLRLLPIAPFFLINLAAGIFAVPFKNFFFATFFGIIPGTFVYANVGASLNSVFMHSGNELNPGSFLNLQIIIAFALLGVISIIPALIKQYRSHQDLKTK